MSQDKKASAKKLFDQGETIAAIARQLDVSRRTIERWADEGAWRERRDVIPIGEGKKAKPVQATPQTTAHINPPSIGRQRRSGESIDEIEILESAIASLSALLTGMNAEGSENPIDARSVSGTAGALVRLLEYRRKVSPPTAADLAEQVLALGIDPSEFVRELKLRWGSRSA